MSQSFYLGTREVNKRIPDQSTDPYPKQQLRTELGMLEVLFNSYSRVHYMYTDHKKLNFFPAIMSVHKDFILYGTGIYAKTFQVSGQTLGHQSVKILGWGSENDVDYWVRHLLMTNKPR